MKRVSILSSETVKKEEDKGFSIVAGIWRVKRKSPGRRKSPLSVRKRNSHAQSAICVMVWSGGEFYFNPLFGIFHGPFSRGPARYSFLFQVLFACQCNKPAAPPMPHIQLSTKSQTQTIKAIL